MSKVETLKRSAQTQAERRIAQAQLPEQVSELKEAMLLRRRYANAILSQQLASQQQQISNLHQENKDLKQQLAALPEALENVLESALQQSLSGLKNRVELLESILPQRQSDSTLQHSLSNLGQKLSDLTQTLNRKFSQLEERVTTVEPKAVSQEQAFLMQAQLLDGVQQTFNDSLSSLIESMKTSDASIEESLSNFQKIGQEEVFSLSQRVNTISQQLLLMAPQENWQQDLNLLLEKAKSLHQQLNDLMLNLEGKLLPTE